MVVDLNERRTGLMLEALKTLDDKWTAIIGAAAAKGDEETVVDDGTNLMMLMTLREKLEELALNPQSEHHRLLAQSLCSSNPCLGAC